MFDDACVRIVIMIRPCYIGDGPGVKSITSHLVSVGRVFVYNYIGYGDDRHLIDTKIN